MEQIQKETPISFIHEAVKVKRANLMKIGQDGQTDVKYVLQHYDTIILEVINGEVIIISKISNSSTRAINQALEYLQYNLSNSYRNKTAQQIVKDFEKQGKYVKYSANGRMYDFGN